MTPADPGLREPGRVPRHRRLPLLLAAAAVLLLGWLGTSSPVPIYDGVGMPDEPYRFVAPPAGYRPTPPVTPARTAIQLDAGRSCCELEARSAEQGPQVAVYVPRAGLASPGSGVLTVTAEAAAPPPGPVPVEDGMFEGNAYRVTTTGPAGPATLTPEGSRATLQLRALDGNTPGPAIWYRTDDAAAWRELPTGKVGFDIYESQFVGAGSYILVRGPEGGTGQTTAILLGILAVPALLVVVLVVLRLRGGAPRDPDEDETDGDDAAGGETAAAGETAGGDPTGNNLTGNDLTGNDPTGDDPTGNDPTGDDPTGNDPTGDDSTGNGPAGGDRR